MPQLHSNFELNSKLSNFTRDSFKSLDEMLAVNPLYIDEGHISYCQDTKKHYVFHTVDGKTNWIELLTQVTANVVETESDLNDEKAKTLEPGTIILVKDKNKLYYRGGKKYNENSTSVNGYFHPILTSDEIDSKFNILGSDVSKNLKAINDIKTSIDEIQTTLENTYTKDSIDDLLGDKANVDSVYTKSQIDEAFRKKANVSSVYTKSEVDNLKSEIEAEIKNRYSIGSVDALLEGKADKTAVYSIGSVDALLGEKVDIDSVYTKTYIDSNYLSNTVANDTYAKKEDIVGLLDKYIPKEDKLDDIIAVDIAEGLQGKTGQNIKDSNYALNEIFDKILFKEIMQEFTQPSLELNFKIDEWGGEWYDDKKKILLVKSGSTGPSANLFTTTNVINSFIKDWNGNQTDSKYTNGLNSGKSIAFCKIKNENGEWDYYKQNGMIYHVPSVLTEPGDYRYYYVGYFNSYQSISNNKGTNTKIWDINTPVETQNYITINSTKPVKYYTREGWVENRLLIWEDDMVDYFELSATCQAEQKFMLPRKAKYIYVWNGLCGYAKDLSFEETINNDYFIYSYDHTINGHRGAIKIKVEF